MARKKRVGGSKRSAMSYLKKARGAKFKGKAAMRGKRASFAQARATGFAPALAKRKRKGNLMRAAMGGTLPRGGSGKHDG